MSCLFCDHDFESKTICDQCAKDLREAEREYGAEGLNICAVSKLIDSRKKSAKKGENHGENNQI